MTAPKTQLYVWQLPDWPSWTYDAQAISTALALAHRQHGIAIGKAQAVGLNHDSLVQIMNESWTREALATAAIEGETLDLNMVRSSIMRKLDLADSGPSSRRVDGLIDLMHDAAQHHAARLDLERLCRWQAALFPDGISGMKRIETGKLRSFSEPMLIVSGKIGREKIHFRAPDSYQVEFEMKQFLDWFNSPSSDDGIVRAGLAHLWFETIHPFEDGNGRIGRAIIDMALAQHIQQPAWLCGMSRQLQKNRSAYYACLNKASTSGLDVTDWLNWFISQFTAACQQSCLEIDMALEKAHFWAQHASQDVNERQRKTLQKLLDAGDGGYVGGMSADKHTKITGASKATATRDLTDLVAKGLLITRDQGKATRYFVNIPGWNQSD